MKKNCLNVVSRPKRIPQKSRHMHPNRVSRLIGRIKGEVFLSEGLQELGLGNRSGECHTTLQWCFHDWCEYYGGKSDESDEVPKSRQ